jgi:dihydrolipoamide dehydrogenase
MEAEYCVENINDHNHPAMDYGTIPGATYCQPQVASVGLTEEKAKELGYDIKVGRFPFQASGKARAIGHSVGHVKVIFDAQYGELLGTHIVGHDATEMIAEGVLAQRLGANAGFIMKTSHAHPTLSESFMEAVANAEGEAIHI